MEETRVKQVFSDEEFVKGLFQLDTPEEVQTALAGKGIDLSVPDIIKIKDLLQHKIQSGEELSEEDLEGVTGGVLVMSTLAGLCLAAGIVGFFAVASTGILVGSAWGCDSLTNHKW